MTAMTVASAICFAVAACLFGGLVGWLAGKKSGFMEGIEAVKSFLAFVHSHKGLFSIVESDDLLDEKGADDE